MRTAPSATRAAAAATLAALCALPFYASAQDSDFPGVERLMSEQEQRATGVHRLTDTERKALNAWLLRYTAGEAELLQRSSSAVREEMQNTRIEARLSENFKGWSGNTVFYLDNGQVWRQRLPGRFRYSGDNLDVVIETSAMGLYRMTHVASGRSVGVTLLK